MHSLEYGSKAVSDAKYRYPYGSLTEEISQDYFSAISFTETPLDQIKNMLDIDKRKINFQPYGLVFLKEELTRKGVSPVIYINNAEGDKDRIIELLCQLIHDHPDEAVQILPFIAIFGKYLSPMGGRMPIVGDQQLNFTWEREWRFASKDRAFKFDKEDIFVGLCPSEHIGEFERNNPGLKFIDPRNVSAYVEKVSSEIDRLELKYDMNLARVVQA